MEGKEGTAGSREKGGGVGGENSKESQRKWGGEAENDIGKMGGVAEIEGGEPEKRRTI